MYTKKLFQLVALLVLVSTAVFGQTTTTWTGFGSDGKWSNDGNWDNAAPTATTPAVINSVGMTPNAPFIDNNAVCQTLTINTGGQLTLSGTFPLTVSGTVTIAGTLYGGTGIMAFSGDWVNTGTFSLGTSSKVTLNGNVNQTISNTTTFYNLYIAKTGGIASLGSGADISIVGALNINGGTLNAGSSNINFTGSVTPFTITSGTFNCGTGKVTYKNPAAINILSDGTANSTYNDLTFDRNGNTFSATSSMTVKGVLTVTNATTFHTGPGPINLIGSIVLSGTGAISTLGGTLNFNGTSQQSIPGIEYNILNDNNTSVSGVTISGATAPVTVATLNIAANATFSDGGYQLYTPSTASTIIMGSGATLKLGSVSTATNMVAFETTTGLNSNSTIEFAANPNQSVLANFPYQKVIFSGSNAKTVNACTITGDLTISNVIALINGPVTLASTSTLTNNGTITVTANATGNGLNIRGIVAGQTQTVGVLGGTGGTVTFSPTATQTVDLGTINFSGTTVINNAAVLNFVNSTNGSTFKILSLTGASVLTPINDWTISGSGGNLTLSGSASLSINPNRTITISGTGGLVIASTNAITSAGTISITGNKLTLNGLYHGTGASVLTFNPAAAGTVKLSALVSSDGSVVFNGGTNQIDFDGAGAAPGTLTNLAFTNQGTSIAPFGTPWVLNGNLTIGNGTTVDIGGSSWKVGGSITETGSGKFLVSGGGLLFNGSAAATWTLGGNRTYTTLAVTVGLPLGKSLDIIGGNLQIGQLLIGTGSPYTTGVINMNGSLLDLVNLTIGGGGASSSAYIWNGTVASTLSASSTAYTFPVGDATSYAPLIFTTTAGVSVPGFTTVAFVNADPGGTTPNNLEFPGTGGTTIVVSRASAYYWNMNVANTQAGVSDIVLDLRKVKDDPFQTFDIVRAILRDGQGDNWSKITGTYTGNTGAVGSGGQNTVINKILVNGTVSAALTPGVKKIAYGLKSAVVKIEGLVYYGDMVAGLGSAVANVGVTLFDAATSTTVSLGSANPVMTATSALTYSFPQVGGITTSGYLIKATVFPAWTGVTGLFITDAIEVRNFCVGRTAFVPTAAGSTLRTKAADVNADGKIDPIDAMQIMQKSVELLPTTNGKFAAGEWYSNSITTSNSLLSSQLGQDLRIIAIGDAAYSSMPSALTKASVKFANAGNLDVDAKQAFSVPIQLVGDAIETAGFGMCVKYPADKVEFKGVVSSFEGLTAIAKDGYVRMYWMDMSGKKPVTIAKDANIMSIKFQPKEGFNTNIGFDLTLDENHTSFGTNNAELISLSLNAAHVGAAIPTEFALSQNYPNPFNPTTTMDYSVPEVGSKVSIKIYNVIGQQVATLFDGVQEPGRYTAQWNARSLASGVYIVRMTGSSATKNFSKVVKLMLLK